MPKYIMVYKSDPIHRIGMSKEEITKVMQAWGEWLGSMGPAVISKGDAFKVGGKSVTATNTQDADNILGGYSVIEAKDFDEALSYAQKAPVIHRGGSVEVYEGFGV